MKPNSPSDPLLELSRPLLLEKIGHKGLEFTVCTTVEECAALACRFKLIKIENFQATLNLSKAAFPAVVSVEGNLSARITQSCVVTFNPVKTKISKTFKVQFCRKEGLEVSGEIDLASEEGDVEFLEGVELDLGELAVQYLALAIDDYPHAPEADAIIHQYRQNKNQEEFSLLPSNNPFSQLEALKKG